MKMLQPHMSLHARKLIFGVSDQVRHKSACTVTEAGYRLEILAVTAQLICGFVFAYADCWFSFAAAQCISIKDFSQLIAMFASLCNNVMKEVHISCKHIQFVSRVAHLSSSNSGVRGQQLETKHCYVISLSNALQASSTKELLAISGHGKKSFDWHTNAPVICNHCPSTYAEGWGIAELKCGADTF